MSSFDVHKIYEKWFQLFIAKSCSCMIVDFLNYTYSFGEGFECKKLTPYFEAVTNI